MGTVFERERRPPIGIPPHPHIRFSAGANDERSHRRRLGEIGISVSVEAVDWGTWFDVVTNQRDFDMTIDFALGNIDPGVHGLLA